MTTTPPPEQPAEEIDQIFMDAIIDHYKHVILNENDLKAAIMRLLQRAELEAQIAEMNRLQEVKFNETALDNSVVYMYAYDRIADLQKQLTKMEK